MIISAIQLGSSRILAVAAHKDPATGRLSDIQIESEPARDCISHGRIVNTELAAMHFRSLLQKLSNRMRATITSAYVGLGGISLHSLQQQPSVQLPDHDVLASEPISGGHYQLMVAQKRLRERVIAAMERAGLKLIDIIALPKATASILTADERQKGCLLVDMGAGTTTVAIYKDNYLRHLAVIPLGSDTVTLDIQSAGCSYDDAERLKLEWSNVAQDAVTASSAPGAQFAEGSLPISLSQLNKIALCRYEEIAANIQHQIQLAGFKGLLQAGCILTGGAAMQNGLTTLLRRYLSLPLIVTRAYSERALIGSERKTHLTNTLALLSFCTADCQATAAAPAPAAPPLPAPTSPKGNNSTKNDGQITLDLPDDDSDYVPESHPIRDTFMRFAKDLFTGQK